MATPTKSPSNLTGQRAGLLERLLAQAGKSLRRQARRNSLNQSDAEDALQEGCVQFLRFYDGPVDDALPWLMLVVKRCAWRIGERARKHRGGSVVTSDCPVATEREVIAIDEGAGPLELVERSEAVAERIELLAQLKPDERTTLILIALGCSYREIMELRGWTHTKVNRCAAEGRARLRELREGGRGGDA